MNLPVAENDFTGYQTFGIFAIVVLITIGIGSFVYNYDLYSSPWWSDRIYTESGWTDMFDSFKTGWFGAWQSAIPFSLAQSPVLDVVSNRDQGNKGGQKQRESWCFVGEDLTGRYCVKVPSPKSCTRDRLYYSRLDCELHLTNALPAGVITDNGVKYDLLSSGRTTP